MATRIPVLAGLLLAMAAPAAGARLKPDTARAFDAYVRAAEQAMEAELSSQSGTFVWLSEGGGAAARLSNGEILIHRRKEGTDIPSGLLHDWTGAMLVKGRTLDQVVDLLTDYGRHQQVYPEVVISKVLAQGPGTARTFLRLRRKKIVTVVYNTEYDVSYSRPAENRWQSRSRSTRIAQVDNAGEADEKELPIGNDSGYLWRLNAYWRVEQRPEGALVSCRAISLSRGIPFGLGWIVKPFVQSVPRESLEATLEATREAVSASAADHQ